MYRNLCPSSLGKYSKLLKYLWVFQLYNMGDARKTGLKRQCFEIRVYSCQLTLSLEH